MTDLSLRLPLLALLAGLALPSLAQSPSQNGYGVQQPIPIAPNGGIAKPQPQVDGNPYAVPVPAPAPQSVTPHGYGIPAVPPLPPPAEEAPKATTPPSPTLSDLGRSLRSYFTEEELSLLFQYMKESVMASFKGEEVFLPPDLSFKLEILLVRMKKESGHYMDNLIDQLEKDLKTSLKEKLTPPPIKEQPYNPWYTPPQR